jgi:hypothetical protein
VAVFFVYETAQQGGTLVYTYAGGVGLRTGDTRDVERLLLAGYYHQVQADRKAGRAAEAAELMAAAAKRFGADIEVRLLAAESLLLDRKDPQGAVAALDAIQVPAADTRLRVRRALLQADAHETLGQIERAVAILEPIAAETKNARVRQRIDALRASASTRGRSSQ